jgi:hypothetical protein
MAPIFQIRAPDEASRSTVESAGFDSTSGFKAEGTANRLYSSDTWTIGISYVEDESANQVTISVYAAD